MPVLLNDFVRSIDELLDSLRFNDSCLNGLQIEGRKEIKSFATSVSASMVALEQAKDMQVDALIVHHGLFWKGADPRLRGSLKDKVAFLLKHGISLIAYHLPLDAHQRLGNNWGAAKEMGWHSLTSFCPYQGNEIGVRGQFKQCSRNEFKRKLEDFYEHEATTVYGGKEHISSVALVSGGAHKSIYDAIQAGVDCFVTGTFDEYIWYVAQEENINFYALGHAATEKIGPRLLGEELQKRYGISHIFIDENNPF